MCGIVGQIAFSTPESGESGQTLIRHLIGLMARRGPDNEGLWTDGQRCTLGFRRLAILDLSPAGNQPMATTNGRYVIVYNGELYNYRELRSELAQKGIRFRSSGDTEVVLNALSHWGVEGLRRFNGMFALALYDTVGRRLLLARDHAGMKPLYYLISRWGLVFASQYDQILGHPWSQELNVSAGALGLYARLRYIPAPYALLENTHMLEPGAWIELTDDNVVRNGRFFDFPVYQEPDLRGEASYEAVDAAITAAVRRHLVSDVSVGTFLSGGIDSPLIAGKMNAMSNKPVKAFTLGTYQGERDESSDAAAYAEEIGVQHIVERLTPGQVLDTLNHAIAACGEPFADSSIFPTLIVSRLASKHVKVMLSGDGGDELFWGYVQRCASVLAPLLRRDEYRGAAGPGGGMRKLLAVGKAVGIPEWPCNIGELYRLKHAVPEAWLRQILPDLPPWPADFSLFDFADWEPDRTAQWMRWHEFKCYLPKMLLKVDRASMYHSLEVRVPLLDREVLEVAGRVDWRSCLDIQKRVGKLPLRHLLSRQVHHQTWTKRGFSVPVSDWLRGPLRPVCEEFLLGKKEILGLTINRKAAKELFDLHISRRADYGVGLWVLLSLSIWQSRHYRVQSRSVPIGIGNDT